MYSRGTADRSGNSSGDPEAGGNRVWAWMRQFERQDGLQPTILMPPVDMGIMLGEPGVAKDQGGIRGVDNIKAHLLVMVTGEEETHQSADVCDVGQPLAIQRVGHHWSLESYGC